VARMKTGVFHIRAMTPPGSQSSGAQSVPKARSLDMELALEHEAHHATYSQTYAWHR
jgi:hypothetical protein